MALVTIINYLILVSIENPGLYLNGKLVILIVDLLHLVTVDWQFSSFLSSIQ